MEERFRFVEEWWSGDWSLAELCRFYGVTRVTGYKWIGRYEAGGLAALEDQSRAPHRHPNAISAEMEEQVIAMSLVHTLDTARTTAYATTANKLLGYADVLSLL